MTLSRFGWLHAVRLELRQDESVDLVPRPRDVLDGRRNSVLDWLKGPPALLGLGHLKAAGRRRLERRVRGGPRCPEPHPSRELGDVRVRQLLLRRHLRFIEIADGLNQETLARLAWQNSRTCIPAA